MRRALLVVGLLLVPASALSDELDTPASGAEAHRVGASAAAVIPVDVWGDAAGPGFGVMLGYEFAAADKVALTGRVGYLSHSSRDQVAIDEGTGMKFSSTSSTSELPILAGVKYRLVPNLYGQIELGLVYFDRPTRTGGVEKPDSATLMASCVGMGYEIENFDFAARLFVPNLMFRRDGEILQGGMMIDVGYAFFGF